MSDYIYIYIYIYIYVCVIFLEPRSVSDTLWILSKHLLDECMHAFVNECFSP